MVIGIRTVHHVRTRERVEKIRVMDRIDRPLQLQHVEVEHRHEADVGPHELEKHGAHDACTDADPLHERIPSRQPGISGIRCEVADGPFMLACQLFDHRLEMMPVLPALGVDDDIPSFVVETGKAPESAPVGNQSH